jgi:hypothetical protein
MRAVEVLGGRRTGVAADSLAGARQMMRSAASMQYSGVAYALAAQGLLYLAEQFLRT